MYFFTKKCKYVQLISKKTKTSLIMYERFLARFLYKEGKSFQAAKAAQTTIMTPAAHRHTFY